jgi:hypothetical protein
MREEKLVQFACFETPLDTEEFIVKWEQFIRPANSDTNVTIQQSKKNGVFRYVVQYRCVPGQFQFNFKRERRSSKIKQIPLGRNRREDIQFWNWVGGTRLRKMKASSLLFLLKGRSIFMLAGT